MDNTRKQAVGFTIIELLVVITIIAILVAILLPTLNRVREQTRRVLCVGNTQQVGAAMMSFARDNDGDLPGGNATLYRGWGIDSTYAVPSKSEMGTSFFVTQGYIPSAEVLYCPTWSHPYNQYDEAEEEYNEQE